MRAWTILLPLALMATAASCSSDPAPTTASLCTPGANVFCRCKAPSSEGTKRCADDGKSFSECDCGEVVDTGTFVEEDTATPLEDTGSTMDTTMSGGEEKCPGKTVAVDAMMEKIIDGDTSAAMNDSTGTGACAVAAGNDHVYAVIPTGTGKLAIKLTGTAPLDPTLIVREGDCMTGKQAGCGETTGVGGAESTNINVTTGTTYYVWVDGKAGTAGAYKLSLTLTTGAFCGDGTVDPGEGCDDGNKVTGDGCENDCRPTGDVDASRQCPGVAAHVWPSKPLTWSGSTTTSSNLNSAPNSTTPMCTTFGSTAPERVYSLVAHKTGTLKIEATGMYNIGIYAKKAPCASGPFLACGNNLGLTPIPQVETISFPVTDGTTYYLFVDGAGAVSTAWSGTFTIRATLL